MKTEILIKINNDKNLHDYLRKNSYWYKYLNRSDKYYKDLIVEYLKQYDKARKKEIRELLWDKLPDALSEKQKEN